MRVRRLDALEEARFIASWDRLALTASEPNPFYESWFLLPLLHQFDTAGEVAVFTLEQQGQLVGLIPLHRDLLYYGYPLPNMRGLTQANCFLGAPLVAPGCEADFWRELLGWADANSRTALFLHLAHMPASGALHEALASHLAETGRSAATVMLEERAMLVSGKSPEAYFVAALSAKKRKELRRQRNRLAELGDLSVECSEPTTSPAGWCDEFLQLEQRGWKGAQQSALRSDKRTEQLFREALDGAARRGKLQCLTLRLNGDAIAMLATFLTPPGAFSFKTAFDEDYARFSPGVLLQQENLEVLADDRVAWVDSCAAADHPMINHLWRERRPIARYSIAIGGSIRRSVFAQIAKAETGSPVEALR